LDTLLVDQFGSIVQPKALTRVQRERRNAQTRYAKAVVKNAYQVLDESADLVCPRLGVNIRSAGKTAFAPHALAFSRLILFDRRYRALRSDRRDAQSGDRADDMRAVLDAVGSERAALLFMQA
jgi:hypothetical protein